MEEAGIKEFLEDQIYTIAATKELEVLTLKVMPDHIHLFISTTPFESPTGIVKVLKGVTALRLFKKFPELRNKYWKGKLWSPNARACPLQLLHQERRPTQFNYFSQSRAGKTELVRGEIDMKVSINAWSKEKFRKFAIRRARVDEEIDEDVLGRVGIGKGTIAARAQHENISLESMQSKKISVIT